MGSTPWPRVRAMLEARGLLDADGIARTIRASRCPACGSRVLRGLDRDRVGLVAVVDLAPVDPPRELAAVLTGRWTYRLTRSARGWELDHRNDFAIAGHSANEVPVLAEHVCGRQLVSPVDSWAAELTHRESADAPPY